MKDDRQYVEIDHANKRQGRSSMNPNRAKRQAMQREAGAILATPRAADFDNKKTARSDQE